MGIRIPSRGVEAKTESSPPQDDHAYLSLAAGGPLSPATSRRGTKTPGTGRDVSRCATVPLPCRGQRDGAARHA